jgi:hypothetical protein
MDNGGSNCGSSFEIKHGPDAAEVTDVHEAGAREIGDVVWEGKIRIKNNTKIADGRIGGKGERWGFSGKMYGRIRYFLDLVWEANDDEFCFGRIQGEEVGWHPSGDLVDYIKQLCNGGGEAGGVKRDEKLRVVSIEMMVNRWGFYEMAQRCCV